MLAPRRRLGLLPVVAVAVAVAAAAGLLQADRVAAHEDAATTSSNNNDNRPLLRKLQEQKQGAATAGCRARSFEESAGEGWELKAADMLTPGSKAAPAAFGRDFAWGAATSAYQIEGGWDKDGRGASIWDTFSHTPGKVTGGGNGDVACNSYELWEQDVALLKQLGVTHYRFSVAWPRVMPTGEGPVNEAGLAYYAKLVDALVDAGIEPAVTLYHWDLPQALQDKGGWQSADTAAAFAAYSDAVFAALGDKVKMWFTLNEPWSTAVLGHGLGAHAPGIKDQAKAVYEAGHNQLLAHAAAAKVYREKYKAQQGGKLGIVLSTQFKEPACDTNPADVEAAERNLHFYLGWFAHPIFKGDYPPVMRQRAGDRLPAFTAEQQADLKGSIDFLGLNTYSSSLVTNRDAQPGGYFEDLGTKSSADPAWPKGASSWLYVAPPGMRKLLQWAKKEYGSPVIYITENGVDIPGEDALTGDAALDDAMRVQYIQDYVAEVAKAIKFDKVDVRGYFAWSLLDNFEWSEGYGARFGLVRMDYTNLTRMPKRSFEAYADLIGRYRGQ